MTTNDIEMRVDIDIAQAKAELESLKRSVSSFAAEVQATTRNLQLKVTAQADTAKALAELTALKTLAQDTVMRVEVRVDSVAANTALAAFRAGLNNETIRINIDASGTVGAQGALDGIRNSVLGLGAALATTLPVLRDYNDELNRMQLAARAAAGEIRRAADEQERLRRAGGGGGGNGGDQGGGDNDGSVWRKHALAVANVAQEYSGLSARLLATKSAMAVLTASAVGLVPVLTQMATVAGFAFGTALATANVAAASKELENLARSTAISKQALQEWRLAARFEGVSADLNEFGDMSKVFSELDKQVKSLGTEEGKEFAESLKTIGLSAKDLKDAKADEALLKIGEALGKTKLNDAQKSTFLAGISDDAAKLLPLLEKQAIEFKEIRDYANGVGAIQSDAQLESMRLANYELSYLKLGLEGVQTQLSSVGANVLNTLGTDLSKLFIDARKPIQQWSNDVDKALKKFKADLDSTGSWTMAIKLSLKDAYPTLYGFVASAADFGRGYGQAFITPMLNELKRGYASIRGALGNAGGAENLGKSVGEAMLPIVGIVRNVSGAVKILIDNWSTLKMVAAVTPAGFAIANWDKVSSVFNTLGNAIKSVAGYFKLISPETAKSATGMQMFTASLLGLVAAGATTRLALGAVGAAFSVMRFALSPAIVAIQFAPAAFTALATSAGIAGRALQVLALAARLNPVIAAATAIAAVAGLIVANWDKIAPFFSNLWGQVTSAFKRAFGDIANVPWQQIPAKILSGFASFSADMFKVGATAIGKLAIGLLENLGIIDANTAKIANQAVANFAELPGRMVEMGANIMEGLKNGIVSAGNRAIAAAREISSSIAKAVSGLFKMNSPSRLMFEYGEFISEGLALGIANKSINSTNNAKKMAQSVAGAFSTFNVPPLKSASFAANDPQFKAPQNNEYNNQLKQNADQILQLRLTEQAYQRIKIAKENYSKAQIAGLVAQQKEIALLQAARDAGYRGADSFKNAIQVKAIAATGFLQGMVGGVANANKTMFEINKAASIANALLNAKESVVGAYKFGAAIGGPWLGATFGAIAAAAQAANVASIASQSFGGSGGVAAAGGSASSGANGVGTGSGTSSGSTTDKPKDSPTVTIALSGNDNTQYSKKQVRDLIKHINDAVGDGARLRVA